MKNYKYSTYQPYYSSTMHLALPIIFSQAGQMIVVLADNLMIGQLGATQLAGAALANNIFVVGMVFGIGLVNGITPLVGKEYGGGNRKGATVWLKQAIASFPILAIIQALVMGLIVLLMPYMGQPEEVVKLAIPYYLILVLSIIPFQLFFIFKQYAEGLGNTRIAMVITLTGNVINILLNYILIYGKLGFEAYGIMGAGYATLISRIIMAVIFAIIYKQLSFFKPDRDEWDKINISLSKIATLLKLGFPIAGQFIVEVLAFTLGSIMMGWMGEKALAAHQIVISLASLTFMISSGLAAATTIKVSHFRGEGNIGNIKNTVYSSIHVVALFMLFSLIMFMLFRFKIPGLFVPDLEVIEIAGGLMLIAGLFQLFDGLQVVTLGALRGLEDVKTPMIMVIIAYFPIALPICYVTAFMFDFGEQGIWIGYLTGLILVSSQLLLRFRWKIREVKDSF